MGYPSEPHRRQQEYPPYLSGPDQAAGPPYGYGPPAPPAPPRRHLALVLALAIGVPLLLIGGSATAWFLLIAPVRESITSASAAPADPRAASEPGAAAPDEPAGVPSDAPAEEAAPGGDDGDPLTSEPGGTITLKGMEAGSKVAVTLDEVYSEAQPTQDSIQPKPGNRFMAVQLTLTNKGRVGYKDAPMNGAVVIDSERQQYPFSTAYVEQGQQFHWATSIDPSDSRKGLIVFEVPDGAEMVALQFTLNSGYAEQSGEWKLS
ncbi:DUF4352 domain-containing protein [Nonomuraea gerenzanensis]|uniref:DUF4352 domain-containing protein n=1 Tax=Nonomuraea gerenzanensis TaxID=93944 RepID=A0A1M4EHN7_9ACTN|nr:DUF4352 domain-containing protein [Nonomuraea gerenzanensis]UBU09962.1 DUF4352 domain-containing protein [Nonomuraea gerenzanensis]SBO98415.1 hypothetical protein BN4615_P7931 [Nonomuraea gerenzanensis]